VIVVTVDTNSPTPPFEQLRVAIRRMVATGALPVGVRVPTVRQLASDLGVAPGTVQRAYRELESEGVLESRGRHGTRVKQAPRPPDRAAVHHRIRDAAATYAAVAAELGLSAESALRHIEEALGT
jgi:GntR family transcriptional regulator